MNLNEAIAANRVREAAKRDVTLSSGKKVTHSWQGDDVWLVNEDLSSQEWVEYVGVAVSCSDVAIPLLLDRVIDTQIKFGTTDREDALRWIAVNVERDLFGFARMHGVLVNDSAEDFAIEFYNAYNAEIGQRY